MLLTLMINYAVRLLMYVAKQPERLCIIWELAQACEISEAHLMKVTHQCGPQGCHGPMFSDTSIGDTYPRGHDEHDKQKYAQSI